MKFAFAARDCQHVNQSATSLIKKDRLLQQACWLAALAALGVSAWVGVRPVVGGSPNPIEPAIIPTVYTTLSPRSAINLPLNLKGDAIMVWHKGSEQRMLFTGHFSALLGYRVLQAEQAMVTLTPTRDGGENSFDVAMYLSGKVQVQEGTSPKSAVTSASELLITTRIAGSVKVAGGTPVAKSAEDDPIVKRGDVLRDELLSKPTPLPYIPTIVFTDTENALQNGWIARGPGNRIIAGPAETALATGPEVIGETSNPPPEANVAVPPPPQPKARFFASADRKAYETVDNQTVLVASGSLYLTYTPATGGAPIELRAQRAVLFLADDKTPRSSTENSEKLSERVLGVYLEGDVTIDRNNPSKGGSPLSNETVRAERVFYDLTTNRAIMLDAVLSAQDPLKNIPMYMRASEIRMLAQGEYAAKNVNFSLSEFATPHYHIGASDAYLQRITPLDEKGNPIGSPVYGYTLKNDTINVRGLPVFWWPYMAGDTSKNDIPLRKLMAGYNNTYGMTIETTWDLFGLAGKHEPKGLRTDLHVDYFGKRGPAGGVDNRWMFEDDMGQLNAYIMEDHGTDTLSRDREDIAVNDDVRYRLLGRERHAIDENWTLSMEGSYISDPNYLEQFFPSEYETDKENETDLYLKYQKGTAALSMLGKWSLYDFTANADLVDDQFTTEKKPEVKYYRIGDSLLDVFTYYSESGVANMNQMFTNYTPAFSGLQGMFPQIPANQTFRQYYLSKGWTNNNVLRGDTRQELDMPLTLGDVKVTPYVTGRATAWDDAFPDPNTGNTTRLWGQAGVRSSMQFWRVYDDAESNFWDVHRIRHMIEPEFQIYQTGSTVSRADLQPFDRDVEAISQASGTQFAVHQKWQTKRGTPGHWRNVDWVVLNASLNSFWNKDDPNSVTNFYPGTPYRGYLFTSRPELSLVQNSLNADLTWRMGEWTRFMAEESYNLDDQRLEQFAQGIAIDQSPYLSYFIGNRYVRELTSDEWTFAVSYQLSKKYTVSASQSYDFWLSENILSSITVLRRMPRFNTALTVSYDANMDDTSVVLSVWPESMAEYGVGSSALMKAVGQ